MRYTGDAKLYTSYNVYQKKPLDCRSVVNTYEDLDKISWANSYVGMLVVVLNVENEQVGNPELYVLKKDSQNTKEREWQKVGANITVDGSGNVTITEDAVMTAVGNNLLSQKDAYDIGYAFGETNKNINIV